jgi:hypothetical protein
MNTQTGNVQPELREEAQGILRELPAEEAQALIIKCWMSHDARWFTAVAMNAGLDVAQRCNRAAIHEEGRIEARRVARSLGIPAPATVRDFLLFQETLIGLLGPDLLDYELTQRGETGFDLVVWRCFAFDNVTKAGIAQQYQCGILPRLTGWLEGLGIDYDLEPEPLACLKAQGAECRYSFTLRFSSSVKPQ